MIYTSPFIPPSLRYMTELYCRVFPVVRTVFERIFCVRHDSINQFRICVIASKTAKGCMDIAPPAISGLQNTSSFSVKHLTQF